MYLCNVYQNKTNVYFRIKIIKKPRMWLSIIFPKGNEQYLQGAAFNVLFCFDLGEIFRIFDNAV